MWFRAEACQWKGCAPKRFLAAGVASLRRVALSGASSMGGRRGRRRFFFRVPQDFWRPSQGVTQPSLTSPRRLVDGGRLVGLDARRAAPCAAELSLCLLLKVPRRRGYDSVQAPFTPRKRKEKEEKEKLPTFVDRSPHDIFSILPVNVDLFGAWTHSISAEQIGRTAQIWACLLFD